MKNKTDITKKIKDALYTFHIRHHSEEKLLNDTAYHFVAYGFGVLLAEKEMILEGVGEITIRGELMVVLENENENEKKNSCISDEDIYAWIQTDIFTPYSDYNPIIRINCNNLQELIYALETVSADELTSLSKKEYKKFIKECYFDDFQPIDFDGEYKNHANAYFYDEDDELVLDLFIDCNGIDKTILFYLASSVAYYASWDNWKSCEKIILASYGDLNLEVSTIKHKSVSHPDGIYRVAAVVRCYSSDIRDIREKEWVMVKDTPNLNIKELANVYSELLFKWRQTFENT